MKDNLLKSYERQSVAKISAAASIRMDGGIFLGGEIRYLNKYQDYLLREFVARATFIGPTMFISIGNNNYFGAAWSIQVAGKEVGSAGQNLDLENFERHQFRIKCGHAF